MRKDSTDLGMHYFAQDYNCAQSVLKSILETLKLEYNHCTNIMAGFGAGVAHQGFVCGAVSGAIAALGIILGESIKDVKTHKEATYDISERFISVFKEQHGSILCDTLTGIVMEDIDQRNSAMEEGIFKNVCPNYVRDAVRITLDLIHK